MLLLLALPPPPRLQMARHKCSICGKPSKTSKGLSNHRWKYHRPGGVGVEREQEGIPMGHQEQMGMEQEQEGLGMEQEQLSLEQERVEVGEQEYKPFLGRQEQEL